MNIIMAILRKVRAARLKPREDDDGNWIDGGAWRSPLESRKPGAASSSPGATQEKGKP